VVTSGPLNRRTDPVRLLAGRARAARDRNASRWLSRAASHRHAAATIMTCDSPTRNVRPGKERTGTGCFHLRAPTPDRRSCGTSQHREDTMTPQTVAPAGHVSQYDAVVKAMACYVDGVQQGTSEIMRPGFHPAASFFGHYPGGVIDGRLSICSTGLTRIAPHPPSSVASRVSKSSARSRACTSRWKNCPARSLARESPCQMSSP
jgi:hypothetical protein